MLKIAYKYLPPSRIDVIENCHIRISQLNALNDPYESLIPFTIDFGENDNIISKLHLKEKMLDNLFGQLNDMIINNIGVISMSRCDTNMLMWAHYALNHTGFIIGFDINNSFFKTSIPGVSNINQVIYSSNPINAEYNEEETLDYMFLQKPIDWAYEEEVRFIDTLNGDNKDILDKEKIPICLRKFPKECIKEIIVGCRSELLEKVNNINKENKINAKIFKTEIFRNSYILKKELI